MISDIQDNLKEFLKDSKCKTVLLYPYLDCLNLHNKDYSITNMLFNINRSCLKVNGFGNRCTLLMFAVQKGDIRFVNALLSDPNLHINKRSGSGYTALHIAVIGGQKTRDILYRLLEVPGIDVNCGSKHNNASEMCCAQISSFPLLSAARASDTQAAFALLRMLDININQQNEAGETSFGILMEKVRRNPDDKEAHVILNLLRLCEGIVRTGKYINAYSWSQNNRNTEGGHHSSIITYDDEHPIVHKVLGYELLRAVTMNDEEEVATLLTNPNIDVNYMISRNCESEFFKNFPHARDELDMYKICMRRNAGSPAMCSPICYQAVKHWETLSTEDPYGDTPLWRAIISQNVEIVQLLCQHPSINVNQTHESSGYSLLTHAIHTGRADIVKLLLNHPNIDLLPLEYRKDWHDWHDVMRHLPHNQVYPCMCEACRTLYEEQQTDDATINKLIDDAYKSRGEYERKEKMWGARNSRKRSYLWDETKTPTQRSKLRFVRRLISRYTDDCLPLIDSLVRSLHRTWICSRDKEGDTLLIQLCRIPACSIISYLIQEQRIPANVGNKGWTPLMIAAHNDQEDTVKLLLTLKGIDLTVHNECADTRSKYWILKHRAIHHEIRRLTEIEMFRTPHLNQDVQRYIAMFLLPKPRDGLRGDKSPLNQKEEKDLYS
jgi:ankyrin repeat protein